MTWRSKEQKPEYTSPSLHDVQPLGWGNKLPCEVDVILERTNLYLRPHTSV